MKKMTIPEKASSRQCAEFCLHILQSMPSLSLSSGLQGNVQRHSELLPWRLCKIFFQQITAINNNHLLENIAGGKEDTSFKHSIQFSEENQSTNPRSKGILHFYQPEPVQLSGWLIVAKSTNGVLLLRLRPRLGTCRVCSRMTNNVNFLWIKLLWKH